VVFLEAVEPLSADFHLVLTTLPGIGFSGPLTGAGWHTGKIASGFVELMARLGYDRYGVQGQGGGAWYALEMARQDPERVIGVHANGLLTFPSEDPADFAGLTEAEQERLGRLQHFRDDMMGFNVLQSTRPNTLAHALTDSPAGQLAWIVEKFKEWADAKDVPENAVDRDQLLTNVMLYWLTGTAGSSARIFYESARSSSSGGRVSETPTGMAVFPHETVLAVRRFAERTANIVYWSEFDRGGHFAAMEEPDLLVADLRDFFRQVR
jgi:epoxide hydrolase